MANYPDYVRVAKPLDSSKVGFVLAVEDGLITRVDVIVSDGVTPGGLRTTFVPADTSERRGMESYLADLFKVMMDASPETAAK